MGDPALRAGAALLGAATLGGSVVAVRLGVPGEPLRIRTPGSVLTQVLVGLGAGVAAPWPIPLAAAVAAAQGDHRRWAPGVAAATGAAVIVGTAVEPVTWGARQRHPAVVAAVAANLTSAAFLVAAGLTRARRVPSGAG